MDTATVITLIFGAVYAGSAIWNARTASSTLAIALRAEAAAKRAADIGHATAEVTARIETAAVTSIKVSEANSRSIAGVSSQVAMVDAAVADNTQVTIAAAANTEVVTQIKEAVADASVAHDALAAQVATLQETVETGQRAAAKAVEDKADSHR